MESAVALNNALLVAQSRMPPGSATLDLPMFVVVGAQSSGKSSVLDNVIGRSFLPRGSGTVTRRPLVLMMQQCASDEYAEFSHLPGQRFTADAQICAAIEKATLDVCGPKGFSSDPIHLRYYAPTVPDLTLVDLPGVIKAHAADMDPRDPATIRRMVLEFATRPNSILLAVTPAVGDLVTSDAIQLAREVDPEGQRTLGVLTKLDLMDDGTDCSAALIGEDPRAPKLRLGYVGVVNRGQKDINKGVDLTAARARERAFFSEHEAYGALVGRADARLGTESLVTTSSALLVEHIQRSLPTIKLQIRKQLDAAEAELAALAKLADQSAVERALVQGVCDARAAFAAQLNPGAGMAFNHTRARAFSAGHDIETLFVSLTHELRAETVSYSFGELDLLAHKMAGVGNMLFDVDQTFLFLVRSQIPKFKAACLSLLERVHERLIGVVQKIELDFEAAFPLLAKELRANCFAVLEEMLPPTRVLVSGLVDMQSARINLAHPDFVARPSEVERFEAAMGRLARQMGPTYGATQKISDVILEADAFKRRVFPAASKRRSDVLRRRFSMWHQRHFLLLRSGTLLWYEPSSTARGAAEAKGSLRLAGCTVARGGAAAGKPAAPNGSRQVSISGEIDGDGSTIVLELADEAAAEAWERQLRQLSESIGASGASAEESAEDVARSAVVANESDEDKKAIRQLTEQGRVNHYKLVHMLESYLSIIQHSLCDLVPKAITASLLNATQLAVDVRLEPTLGRGSKSKAIDELMAPSPEQAAKLKRLQAEVASLRESMQLVAHVRVPPPSEPHQPAAGPARPSSPSRVSVPLEELSNGPASSPTAGEKASARRASSRESTRL